jgi:hypothetical protein
MSWGIENVVGCNMTLGFHVQGYKFTGRVFVSYDIDTSCLNIAMFDDSLGNVQNITGIDSSVLVDTLDQNIELVENYEERVSNQYGLSYGTANK